MECSRKCQPKQRTEKITILSRYSNKMKLPANTFRMLTPASYTLMCNTRRVCFSLILPPSFAFGFTKILKNSSDFKWNGKCSGKQARRTKKEIQTTAKSKIGKWEWHIGWKM